MTPDVPTPRSPNWSRDELMLTLDLYLRFPGRGWSGTSQEVLDMSSELRSLRVFPDEVRTREGFRNAAGVNFKLGNFLFIDPDRPGGLSNYGAGDLSVWQDWAHRPTELAQAVALIRGRGENDDAPPDTGEEEEYEAPEGQVAYREHRRYERDRKLVLKKKNAVAKSTGRLACEVCGFDSDAEYGIRGVIDVHHVAPLHIVGPSVTRLSDLALVCPTCHRTLHKHRPLLTPAELRAMRATGGK